jgi:citrate synthase
VDNRDLFGSILKILINISQDTMLISAREAARRLGVKPATLYAYVSRGLMRSAPGPDSRERRYYEDDVMRLKRLRHAGPRTGAPPKPFDNLVPVLDTSLSLIENSRLYYRGCDASVLAETADLEVVAQLLWGPAAGERFEIAILRRELRRLLAGTRLASTAMERARVILVGLATHDIGALDVAEHAVARTGSRLVAALAAAVTGAMPTKGPVHRQLGHAWNLDDEATDIVRRCLVQLADHELNASTYVGRCIASTGASPYAVILGALGALSGPRHGGETTKVEVLLRESLGRGNIQGAVAERLQRGERIPGFGHPLYPNGDPRAVDILNAVNASRYGRRSEAALRVGHAICELLGRHPNVDFALGLVAVVLKLPPGSGLGMFLIGRSVGWIAHAIEQYATGVLIRPRARYVGILPELKFEKH